MYEIKIFEPVQPGRYAADVYFDGRRIHCGHGGQTFLQAMEEAMAFLRKEQEQLALLELIGL